MELHLFIIWEKGRRLEREITDDIRKHFSILQTIDILWSPEMVTNNFSRFYGVNLPVGIDKQEQCGGGEFRLLIVEDLNPRYDLRETSHGKEHVNINMFDAKMRYRQWVGFPNKIHATNNTKEFDHDLTLLLGINSRDFLSSLNLKEPYLKKQQNIAGARGWDNIEQLFYILGNTVNYVILRGIDGLKTHEFSDSHRDCDLLVDNVSNAQLIINGDSINGPGRPHEVVTIKGYTFFLDLWGWDKNYFDIQWCKDMLAQKISSNGYFILDEANNFYCLLYHCLITKNRFADEYISILEKYRKKQSATFKEYPRLLVDFLKLHHYEIVKPVDNSTGFHIEDPIINHYYNKYGTTLSNTSRIHDDEGNGCLLEWKSCVYDNGNNIVKGGTDWLILNEYSFLQKLASSLIAPLCIGIDSIEGETIIILQKIDGVTLNQFFQNKKNYNKHTIKHIVHQIVDILKTLKLQGIIHRDFTGENIMVDKNQKVNAIDFGWAIELPLQSNGFPRPRAMAGQFRPHSMYSDFYTCGMVLEEISNHHLPYIEKTGKALQNILWDDYFNTTSYNQKIKTVDDAVNASFCFRDHFHCFLFRHSKISRYYYKIKRHLAYFSHERIS